MSPLRAPLLPSLLLLLATAGCPAGSVLLRPDGSPWPERCSEKALKTMRILRMHVGDTSEVQLDANQIDASPMTLYDGPVESYLDGSLGNLDPGTRLYGQVWTSGPQAVVRYYEAKMLFGDTVPICAVVRFGEGHRRLPESKPGTAIFEEPGAEVVVVDSFR
jgi:hypothetical protein